MCSPPQVLLSGFPLLALMPLLLPCRSGSVVARPVDQPLHLSAVAFKDLDPEAQKDGIHVMSGAYNKASMQLRYPMQQTKTPKLLLLPCPTQLTSSHRGPE